VNWLTIGLVREPAALRPALDVRSVELRYGLRCGAALLAGWTALLLLGDRAPVDRKDVLPLPVVSVITGLATDTAAQDNCLMPECSHQDRPGEPGPCLLLELLERRPHSPTSARRQADAWEGAGAVRPDTLRGEDPEMVYLVVGQPDLRLIRGVIGVPNRLCLCCCWTWFTLH